MTARRDLNPRRSGHVTRDSFFFSLLNLCPEPQQILSLGLPKKALMVLVGFELVGLSTVAPHSAN